MGDSTLLHTNVSQRSADYGLNDEDCARFRPDVWSITTSQIHCPFFADSECRSVCRTRWDHLWNLDFALQGGECERVKTAIYETCIKQDSSIKMEEVLVRRNNGNYEKRGRERKDKRFMLSLDTHSKMGA